VKRKKHKRKIEKKKVTLAAVLTAKIYCTFVCFVDLFQSILMYGGQRLKLKDTSREGAVTSTSSDPLYECVSV
jgi:hypothetical protein